MIVYGANPVMEAIRAHPDRVRYVGITREQRDRMQKLIAAAQQANVTIRILTTNELGKLAGRHDAPRDRDERAAGPGRPGGTRDVEGDVDGDLDPAHRGGRALHRDGMGGVPEHAHRAAEDGRRAHRPQPARDLRHVDQLDTGRVATHERDRGATDHARR